MKKKLRILFQSVILGLIVYVGTRPLWDGAYTADFEAYCPFGGLSSLFSKLEMGTMSCNMSEVQVMMGIGLIAGIFFIGKLFCSYICPIGTVTEWLGRLGKKWKIRMEMPELLDRALRSLKYALLFVTIYFTMTASELFCKEYDPYFASANLFGNPDTVLYFAIPAFLIAIIGAVIFRLFWCKYLCPLGAMSNIFMNVYAAGGVILTFVVVNALGAELSFVWLLAGLVLAGFITEVFFKRSFGAPLAKIVKDSSACNDCGLCAKKCPQGIEVDKYDKVNHIDCNLCTDCVYVCSKQALEVNGKKATRVLAPAAVVILIAVSLGFSSTVEFKTISERWGGYEQLTETSVYNSVLKNVKCYGSAMSLKSQLERVPGIHGIDVYAASHTVNIIYDPNKLTETEVVKTLFHPAKQKVRMFKPGQFDSLAVWETGIFRLFDNIDYINLVYALRDKEGVYGFTTHFGEPIRTEIYYNPAEIKTTEIAEAIERDEIEVKVKDGTETRELEFSTDGTSQDNGFISVFDYNKLMFSEYEQAFNKFDEQDINKLSVLVYKFPEAEHPLLKRKLPYLMSHTSKNPGIFKIAAKYLEEGPSAAVYFNPEMTSLEDVQKTLSSENLVVTFRDGTEKEEPNPFKSKPEGNVMPAAEFDQKYNN